MSQQLTAPPHPSFPSSRTPASACPQPHGVKPLYDGKPVDLTPDQEEVATMFAVMKETDYMNKKVFLDNFWEGFKEVLGKGHVIKDLKKCDFTPIYDWHMAQREAKKGISKEVGRQPGWRAERLVKHDGVRN